MRLRTLEPQRLAFDGGAMFGVVPKPLWERHFAADDRNRVYLSMRCLLLETADRKVLVDTGGGDKQTSKFWGHHSPEGPGLVEALAQLGVRPDQITDVFLTHLHFDHVGGGTVWHDAERGVAKPLFAGATYWTHADHWASAQQPNPREAASFFDFNLQPLEQSGQLAFYSPSQSLVPGFDALVVHGHTQAQMLPLLTIDGQKHLYTADLLPTTAHVKPAWVASYDVQPLLTMAEKAEVLGTAADEGWTLLLEHDPVTARCHLHRGEKGLELA